MSTHNHTARTITAEQAAFVLPRLAEQGFKPNEAGEIVTLNMRETMAADRIIGEALPQFERERPRRRVVAVVEGFARAPATKAPPTPLDALRKLGISAGEGEVFHVVGDRALGDVRELFTVAASGLPEGHGWRLFALLDPETVEGKAQWRVTVGRTDVWPYPSATRKTVNGADLMRGVLDKATSAATARGRDFYEANRVDVKPGTLNLLAPGERTPKVDALTPSAALSWLLDVVHGAAKAEGYDLATALTRYADLCDERVRGNA